MRRHPRPHLPGALTLTLTLTLLAAPLPTSALTHEHGLHCDSIAGTWQSRTDVPPRSAELMTVRLRHASASRYTGDARTESWLGPPGSSPPVGCVPGASHTVLTAPMVATFTAGTLRWRITPGALTTISDSCGHSFRQDLHGASFGPVDLAAGTFDATFVYDGGSEHMRWLHVSCSP